MIERGNPGQRNVFMNPEEIELIARAKEGDDQAFSRLVQRHDRRVMSIARSILGNGCDSEEVYQDIFLKVHRKLRSFRFECEFSTWLHRVAINTAISQKRRLKRRRAQETVTDTGNDFFEAASTDPNENPDRRQLRREILEQIERALDHLPARQRTVFVMKHDQGMKVKEIALTLGLAEGTVKAYLFRAVEALRKRLLPYYNISG